VSAGKMSQQNFWLLGKKIVYDGKRNNLGIISTVKLTAGQK